MSRTTHHHVDVQHRRGLVHKLRDLRRQLGVRQVDLADELNLTDHAISRWERLPNPNPHLHTVQRYARAIDHRIDLRLLRLPKVPDSPDMREQRRRAASLNPRVADNGAVALVRDTLVATRRHMGIRLRDVGDSMGCSLYCVSTYEGGETGRLLSTYQRYARALDGRLVARVVPAPVVDVVKVENVHRGRQPFGDLTDAEQVALFRRYRHTAPNRALLDQWRISGTTFARVAALAGQEAA